MIAAADSSSLIASTECAGAEGWSLVDGRASPHDLARVLAATEHHARAARYDCTLGVVLDDIGYQEMS